MHKFTEEGQDNPQIFELLLLTLKLLDQDNSGKVEKREIPGAQTIFIATDSIEKDYKRMIKEDVNFIKHMQVRPWGNEFSVVDPDGNKVEFIQRK